MKFLKSLVIGFMFCALMVGTTIKVSANPPKEIKAEFDKGSKTLKIIVSHPVKEGDIKKHHIAQITVYLDDELVIQQNFKSQSSADVQEVSYVLIDAEKGSKIKIEAKCSIMGSGSNIITVE